MGRLISLCLLAALAAPPLPAERRIGRKDILTPAPLPERSLLVIGFLGGWEEWDNPKRNVRKLALRLREHNLPGVFMETAGNHSRGTMRNFIRDALDRNRDGRLSPGEAGSANLILYGQSWGGAAAVTLAKELHKWNVPVRLTVQVDSIGRRDHTIPPNVRRAVNLYQNDPGPLRGCNEIRAADPARTRILGNIRHTYLFRRIDLSDYPRITRHFGVSHWKMDSDPMVWAEVEGFIMAEILMWQAERFTED